MKDVAYKLDRGVITVLADITEESMVGLVSEIDRMNTNYFYKTIEICISSLGGKLVALDYYLQATERFRRRGIQIRTSALTHACSAAAAILSLGEGPRQAERSTVLLYHFHRVTADQDLTAQRAKEAHRLLSHMDQEMTFRIAQRAFQGYGPVSATEQGAKPLERSVEAFSATDWRIMNRLTGNRFAVDFDTEEENRRGCLAAVRERVAKDCQQQTDASGFLRLYVELFEIDAVMTAALACELRLIDRLADDVEARPAAEGSGPSANAVQIPEWHGLFSSAGRIERTALCRHVMVFGETGSGKTRSAILPVLKAILRQGDPSYEGNSPVSCALVIDPKKELLPVLASEAADGVEVRVLKTCRQGDDGLKLNLMIGEWSIDEDLAANDMPRAAQRILLRCASFVPKNPAFQMLLGRGASDNAYWKDQGVRLAQTIVGLLLVVLKYRAVIFDPRNLNAMAPHVKARLRDFGLAAGLLAPEVKEAGTAYGAFVKEVTALSKRRVREYRGSRYLRIPEEPSGKKRRKPLFSVEERRELRNAWKAFAARICASQKQDSTLREHVVAKRKDFAELLKSPDSRSVSEVADGLKAAAESCWDRACPPLPDEAVRPSRNLMALASVFQGRFFTAGSGKDNDERDQLVSEDGEQPSYWRDNVRPKHYFLAHRLVEEYLRELITEGQGIDDVFDEVDYFHGICATKNDTQHYTGLFAFAKPAFADFSASGPSQALFFGCEPFLTVKNGKEDANRFAGAINSEDGGTVYVYQPSLGYGQDTLIARALKAQFFETVLSDKRRQKNGSEMPLVAYVADEFHRFITSDLVHGEQSFFDTCRSFGAFCVVASQSMSSLHHALAGDEYTNKDEKAVEILLNNTGTKLFFRTTDRALHETIDRLCPMTPNLPKATQVRPPSSLRPGECYAVVTDGRFLRCKIDLNARC